MIKFILFLKSYWYLLYFYVMLRRRGLRIVLDGIDNKEKISKRSIEVDKNSLVAAFRLACNFHFLNVECLERSITLYKLLISSNFDGTLCVGIRRKPFLSHAWVETTSIEELNESKYREKFQVFLSVSQGGS
ncbi:Transglutaminase-like superfamily protein [Seinonella peptonophila]|uniref:Transglutaminase-like superfamily protein n=1 Tax=Seinonella peptonophila TaxID=112248 RepID=A0A1M5AWZ8_9BACL|nr:lasso peptide biosynthesis B2 protein [Seinonella peptonophila]SHF34597.1 Transglutaminase-like superfamily protein [Seinonella peptonophila]